MANKAPPTYQASVEPDLERQAGLPPRPTPKDRMCPNARTCWPGMTIASYSLNTGGDKELLLRRACMIAILAIRTASTVVVIIFNPLSVGVVSIIIGVLGFFFVAYFLHLIGSMVGERKVFGKYFTKWHFDAFLFGTALLQVALLVAACFGFNGSVVNGLWTALGLAIFVVAWVATWPPELRGT